MTEDDQDRDPDSLQHDPVPAQPEETDADESAGDVVPKGKP